MSNLKLIYVPYTKRGLFSKGIHGILRLFALIGIFVGIITTLFTVIGGLPILFGAAFVWYLGTPTIQVECPNCKTPIKFKRNYNKIETVQCNMCASMYNVKCLRKGQALPDGVTMSSE